MDTLNISGKLYISSQRAAKEHGYHTDYIGQLIRGGKVKGQKVGRSWYVLSESFEEYLKTASDGEQPNKKAVARKRKARSSENDTEPAVSSSSSAHEEPEPLGSTKAEVADIKTATRSTTRAYGSVTIEPLQTMKESVQESSTDISAGVVEPSSTDKTKDREVALLTYLKEEVPESPIESEKKTVADGESLIHIHRTVQPITTMPSGGFAVQNTVKVGNQDKGSTDVQKSIEMDVPRHHPPGHFWRNFIIVIVALIVLAVCASTIFFGAHVSAVIQ